MVTVYSEGGGSGSHEGEDDWNGEEQGQIVLCTQPPEPAAKSCSSSASTSRSAEHKVQIMVSTFSPFKKCLVEEIGFGAMLHFPAINKLNLKFSKWIMSNIDVDEQSIIFGGFHEPVRMYHQDIHKVFGIPCGPRDIHRADSEIKEEAIQFIRNTMGWHEKSDHSLKTAEAFLNKDITVHSSRLEKDCFKMAFVVFVTGYDFVPRTKYDYTTIDYWGALSDTDNIERFNWCKYAFDTLMISVRKLKSEMESNAVVNNLSGCHLFLQVFPLDNLDLGAHNLKQNIIPRISLFDGVTLKSMIVNGGQGRKFAHARGLRQGDPLSPLLFVLAMDVLSALIIKAQQQGVLSRMAGCTPIQRISVYADDVVLFIKPSSGDLWFVAEALRFFGEASGLRVNFQKSSAILIRVEEGDADRVAAALPWKLDTFPCKYLGLQLSIKQLTRSEWQPVIDNTLKFLPGWTRGLITRPGRLVLINSVVRARPTHHLIVAGAPRWAIERIDKGCRAFFWAGTEDLHGGKCLVAWSRVCRPKELGGLGVLDLDK